MSRIGHQATGQPAAFRWNTDISQYRFSTILVSHCSRAVSRTIRAFAGQTDISNGAIQVIALSRFSRHQPRALLKLRLHFSDCIDRLLNTITVNTSFTEAVTNDYWPMHYRHFDNTLSVIGRVNTADI